MGSNFKGIIFDLGGVLIKWNNEVSYRKIENKYNLDYDRIKNELEQKLPLVQIGRLSEREWFEDFFDSQGIENLPEDFKIWEETFYDATINYDVLRIVEELIQNGFKLAALSNIEPSRAIELRKREVMGLFDVIVFSCEVGVRKASGLGYDVSRDPDIFTLTVDNMGLSFDECLFVDDTIECIQAAGAVGIMGILFRGSEDLKSAFRKYGIETM